MLTVTHRRPDGEETTFEAVSVTRPKEPDADHVWVDIAGDPSPARRLDISWPHGFVFVMNRYGATVQKYRGPIPVDDEPINGHELLKSQI